MAQTHEQRAALRSSYTLCIEACRADDVSLMEQAISIASKSNSSHAVQDVVQRGMNSSIMRRAVNVLRYLLDHPHGVDVAALEASKMILTEDIPKPSQEILEILVAHGWDINSGDRPFLWYVVEYPDLVRWCLDHGARVDIAEDERIESGGMRRTSILGTAAMSASIETFELLRAKGAPLDRRTLHLALERATAWAPKEGTEPSSFQTERMDMVRHLVDVVKLDVNAVQGEPGRSCTTPLCIVAGFGGRPVGQTVRIIQELASFLLYRGADPNLNCITWPNAIACAEAWGNRGFLQAVENWQAEKQVEKQGEQGAETD